MKKTVLSLILATAWISISEFFRNQFLFKSLWIEHYSRMGLTFPAAPVNGAIWGLWSLLFAIFILILSRKFTLILTTLVSWFAGFVLMWVTIGNLGVLPYAILYAAVPLSLLETFLAALIIKKVS
jgi:hypothetical protein